MFKSTTDRFRKTDNMADNPGPGYYKEDELKFYKTHGHMMDKDKKNIID